MFAGLRSNVNVISVLRSKDFWPGWAK